MIYAITYGDEKFDGSAQVNMKTAKWIGKADKVRRFRPEDIDEAFYKQHEELLRLPRGNGYWIWKPYFILKALDELQDGDYLFYADAGTVYVGSILSLVSEAERDSKEMLFSSSPWKLKYWCKHDAFSLFELDKPEVYEAGMVAGGYMLLKKGAAAIKIMQEWLDWLCNPEMSTDQPSHIAPVEHPCFQEHRHDETIISLLVYKYHLIPTKNFADQNMYKRIRPMLAQNPQWKISLEDVWNMCEEEKEKPYWKNSCHKRVLVNTNIRNHKGIALYLRIIRRVIEAFVRDHGLNAAYPRGEKKSSKRR